MNRAAFAELDRWLAGRGLRAIVHRKPPVRLRRWIGVIVMPGDFQSHCLVMSRDEVLFDPARLELADGSTPPQERAVRRFGLESVGFGYSFQTVKPPNQGDEDMPVTIGGLAPAEFLKQLPAASSGGRFAGRTRYVDEAELLGDAHTETQEHAPRADG